MQPAPIIFFDGICGLCNLLVDQLLKHDHKGVFHFSPLQGKTAQELLGQKAAQKSNTIIYVDETDIYDRSTAVIKIFSRMGGCWAIARILYLIPKGFRDWAYEQVAVRRYGWFGKRESCRLPTAKEKARFLP